MKNKILVGAGIIAVIFLFLAFNSGHTTIPSIPNVRGTSNFDALQTDTTLTVGTSATIGSGLTLTGAIVQNGITSTSSRQAIIGSTVATASTTLCAIQVPAATSTLTSFGLNITTSTSTATGFVMGTTTANFVATTSISSLFTGLIPANTKNTFSFDPSNNNNILAPSSWILVGVSGGAGVTYGYVFGGTCQATFQSSN